MYIFIIILIILSYNIYAEKYFLIRIFYRSRRIIIICLRNIFRSLCEKNRRFTSEFDSSILKGVAGVRGGK